MVKGEKVTQQKEKDFEDVKPNIDFTDQLDDLQETVYDICRDAYSKSRTHSYSLSEDCRIAA